MKKVSEVNWLKKQPAEELAARINSYWAAAGVDAGAHVVKEGVAIDTTGAKSRFVVRSNLKFSGKYIPGMKVVW